jgi:hypothetical protein
MSEKKYPVTYVAENGEKVIAINEIQEVAFIKAGLKEEKKTSVKK